MRPVSRRQRPRSRYSSRSGRRSISCTWATAVCIGIQGVLPKDAAAPSPLAHVLTSAMGGSEAKPYVTRADLRWGDAILLCTDGLTKHVPDATIAERMRNRTHAEQGVLALFTD